MSSIAHLLLLTTILKALQIPGANTIDDIDSMSALKSYAQSLSTSPLMLVAIIAKAVVYLLTYPQGTKELTDGEVDHITTILCSLSQDKLARRYYSSIILQVLRVLCSQPENVSQFMECGIVTHLQTLMEVSNEAEADVIASILWKIISVEDSDEVVIETKAIQGKLNFL